MKKIILTLALISFGSLVQAKEWKTIRVASEGAFPPFNLIDKTGKLAGLEIDFIEELCKEMKVTCTMQAQDWDGMIPALLAKKYDAIAASMSITDERKKVLIFSKPYMKGVNQFIAKKGAFQDVKAATLKGKKIGVQKATISENFVKDNYPESIVQSYNTVDEAYLDLQAGRLELVFNDAITTDESFLKKPEGANYQFLGPAFTDKKWFGEGIGIAMRPEDKELKAIFDAGIDKLYKNGKFKQIMKKYLAQDISIKE